jgi:hypothetical protein
MAQTASRQETIMKLVMRFGAALSIAALSACSVTEQDNNADTVDANATATDNQAPAAEATGPSDTLGNQLNQLNSSDAETADTNSSSNSSEASNSN